MDMDHTGNHFKNTKILIDTGALIPTGVAISEYFFTNHLQGKISDLVPSDLNSDLFNQFSFQHFITLLMIYSLMFDLNYREI